jgi:hypothetical protein
MPLQKSKGDAYSAFYFRGRRALQWRTTLRGQGDNRQDQSAQFVG